MKEKVTIRYSGEVEVEIEYDTDEERDEELDGKLDDIESSLPGWGRIDEPRL